MSLFSIDSMISIISFRPTIALRITAVDSPSRINQCVLARAMSNIKVIRMYKETRKEGLTDLLCSKWESKVITKAEVKPKVAEAMKMAGATALLDKHHRQRSASCKLAYAMIETCTSLAHVDTWDEARDAYQLEGMKHSSRLKLYVLAIQLHQPEWCNYQYQGCWSNRHHTLLKQDFIILTSVSRPEHATSRMSWGYLACKVKSAATLLTPNLGSERGIMAYIHWYLHVKLSNCTGERICKLHRGTTRVR